MLFCVALGAWAPSADAAIELQPGYSHTVYVQLSAPTQLSFDPDGNLFVGNNTGGNTAVKVYRISAGSGVVEEYGDVPLDDPDAVLVDPTGDISGVAGSVLVGVGSGASFGGGLAAIRPDQSVEFLIGPGSPQIRNPNDLVFDSVGRLLIMENTNDSIYLSPDGFSLELFAQLFPTYGNHLSIAADGTGNVFASTESGTVMLFSKNGVLLNNSYATGLGNPPIEVGPGVPPWGGDLYVLSTSSGQLLRFQSPSQSTLIGTGFDTGFGDIAFGLDGALYVSLTSQNRIIRITNEPVAPTCDAGGPYAQACQGSLTSILLDGSDSSDVNGDELSYGWTTDCPGGAFDDAHSSMPTLTVDTGMSCSVTCEVELSVSDGLFVSACSATVTIVDSMLPPLILEPGYTYTDYVQLSGPTQLSFDPAGNLYAGNNTGGNAAVKIYRIPAGGGVAEPYGDSPITDPDAVLFDPSGDISGAAGSVLVGVGGGATPNRGIAAIRPDGSTEFLIGPSSSQIRNPNDLVFDSLGRLLIMENHNDAIYLSADGATVDLFVSLYPAYGNHLSVATDGTGQIFASTENGVIHLYASDGSIINNMYATGVGNAPIELGPTGEPWHHDLFVLNTNNGYLLRFDGPGSGALVGRGFGTTFGDIAFGPDGAMYVGLTSQDRIVRIVIGEEVPTCDIGGPYSETCTIGGTTDILLDGTGSHDPNGDDLTYEWSTDCSGASFDDPTSPVPTLSIDTSYTCSVACNMYLTVDDGFYTNDCSTPMTVTRAEGIKLALGYVYDDYAQLSRPTQLSFDPDGNLFAGNNTGGNTAVKVYRISAGSGVVEEYGDEPLDDPDAVLVDPTGDISGVAGSVLVGVGSGQTFGGGLAAIRPNQSVEFLIGPGSPQIRNPNDLAIDGVGRLLIMENADDSIYLSSDGSSLELFALLSPDYGNHLSVATDGTGRVFASTESGLILLFTPNGSVINEAYATGLGNPPIEFGPLDDPWFHDLFVLNTISGELLRLEGPGIGTIMGTGLDTGFGDIAFGLDGAMYVALTSQDRIIRVVPSDAPVCDIAGDLAAQCQGSVTDVSLDGSGSADPNGDALTFDWSTTCAGGAFDDPSDPMPTLAIDTTGDCSLNCEVLLKVNDGADTALCSAAVAVEDTIAPDVTCTADVVFEDPNEGVELIEIGYGATDNCGAPIVTGMIQTDCSTIDMEDGNVIKLRCGIPEACDDPAKALESLRPGSEFVVGRSRIEPGHVAGRRAAGGVLIASAVKTGQIDRSSQDESAEYILINADTATLVVTASDGCGNNSTCVVDLCTEESE